jgi:hypothetical protein
VERIKLGGSCLLEKFLGKNTIDGGGAGPAGCAAAAAQRGGARRGHAPAQNARAKPLAQVVLRHKKA